MMSVKEHPLCVKARTYASQAHAGQKRKSSTEIPYIHHPMAVADRLSQWVHDPEIIAAAYLHDVIEDTKRTPIDLRKEFGDRVCILVLELTSDEKEIQKNGKKNYLVDKINHLSPDARLIKFADREHNVSELHLAPSDFAHRYAEETQFILTYIKIIPNSIERELIASIQDKIAPYLKH